MELFTYLMAKNDHNTSVNKDLFSYLLGKNQSGTYTDYSGTSLSINNTKKGKMKVNLLGNTSQTGTPTPSSPIPVNIVSGDNTIVSTGKNLLDVSKIVNGYWYDASGNFVGNGNWCYVNQKIGVEPNTAYTLSRSSSATTASQMGIVEFASDGTFIKQYAVWQTTGIHQYTFTTQANTNYIYCQWNKSFDMEDVMFEKGSTRTSPYEAYIGTSYSVNLGVENLVGTTDVSTTTNNDITYSIVGDTITINGTASANTTIMATTNFKLSENTKYTLSLIGTSGTRTNGGIGLRFRKNGSQVNYIQTGSDSNSKSMDLTDIDDVQLYILNGTVLNNYSFKFQLEKGSKANSYTPYGTTPIELCKISTYQDRFFKNIPNTTDYNSDLEDNEWYLEKKIGKHIITDSDVSLISSYWYSQYGQYGAGISKSNFGLPDSSTNRQSLCNVSSKIDGQTYIANNTYIFNANASYVFFFSSDFDTKEHANEKLVGANVYFNLDTPTYTPITGTLKDELEAVWRANSYKGTTNINQINNDLPFNLDVEIKVGS